MYGLPKNVCDACDPRVHIDVPSIGFVYVCVCMSEEISSFRSLRARSQVFALLVLFLCVIFHTMWLLCILLFGILCSSAIRIMFVNIILAVRMLVGIVV